MNDSVTDDRCWCLGWPGPHRHAPDTATQPCPAVPVTREEWIREAARLAARNPLGSRPRDGQGRFRPKHA